MEREDVVNDEAFGPVVPTDNTVVNTSSKEPRESAGVVAAKEEVNTGNVEEKSKESSANADNQEVGVVPRKVEGGEDTPMTEAAPIQVVITAKRNKNKMMMGGGRVITNSGLTPGAILPQPTITCFHCGRNGHKVMDCRCLPVPGDHEGFIYFHSPLNKNRVKCRVCEIVLRNASLIDAHATGEHHQRRLFEFRRRKISLGEMLEREAAKNDNF